MGRGPRLASISESAAGEYYRASNDGAMMAALRRGGAWDSALSADEFAAIRSVGFEPVARYSGPPSTI